MHSAHLLPRLPVAEPGGAGRGPGLPRGELGPVGGDRDGRARPGVAVLGEALGLPGVRLECWRRARPRRSPGRSRCPARSASGGRSARSWAARAVPACSSRRKLWLVMRQRGSPGSRAGWPPRSTARSRNRRGRRPRRPGQGAQLAPLEDGGGPAQDKLTSPSAWQRRRWRGEGAQGQGVGVQGVLVAEEPAAAEGGAVAHDLHGDGLRRGDVRAVGAQPVVGEGHWGAVNPSAWMVVVGRRSRRRCRRTRLGVPAALPKTMTTSRGSRLAPIGMSVRCG